MCTSKTVWVSSIFVCPSLEPPLSVSQHNRTKKSIMNAEMDDARRKRKRERKAQEHGGSSFFLSFFLSFASLSH
jgi:hypothetical protein